MIGFDLGDVDNRMDEERSGEHQFDCIRHDHGDSIWSNLFLDQFLCWIGKSKIGHGQLHLVTSSIERGIRTSRFGSVLYLILRFEKGSLNILISLTNFLCKLIPHSVTRSFEPHSRQEVLVMTKGVEWGVAHRMLECSH